VFVHGGFSLCVQVSTSIRRASLTNVGCEDDYCQFLIALLQSAIGLNADTTCSVFCASNPLLFSLLMRIPYLLVVAILIQMMPAQAQTELDERAMIYSFKGIQFATKDTSFYINFRFRMQPRMGLTSVSGEDLNIDQVEARIRRLRMRVDGFIINRKLSYSIQLSFARADTDFENTGFANIIRDAVVFYQIHKKFYVAFGQNKLPGNRQRVNSSGQLQFADRSIVNATFNLDRDFGLKAYYNTMVGKMGFILKGAVSTGDGRSVNFTDNGLAYTLRAELLPMGLFTNEGDYSEGDLEREPKPKLAFGVGYSFNSKALRTGGQLGRDLYAARDISTIYADALFKYKGFAFATEFMSRDAQSPITYNEDSTLTRFVYKGFGLNAQTSYLFRKNYELAVRYSLLSPNKEIQHLERQTDVIEIGGTKYLNKHRIKVQLNVNYTIRQGNYALSTSGNKWGALLQVEVGI